MYHSKISQCGTVLLELALFVPLFLSMLFGTLEFAVLLKTQQALSAISFESANSSFRNCASLSSPQACLNGDQANFTSYASATVSSGPVDVVLAIYKFVPAVGMNPDMVQLSSISGVSTTTGLSTNGFRSKYTPADLLGVVNLFRAVPASSFPVTGINEQNPTIVISEVFHMYTPMGLRAPMFQKMLTKDLYEATIY